METQGEYPHKVWIVWSSNMPEEGCRVLPESTGSTTAEVFRRFDDLTVVISLEPQKSPSVRWLHASEQSRGAA